MSHGSSDYFLGGAHNLAVDRELGERIAEAYPDVRASARGQRTFLARAVRYCVEHGTRQFLDLGSGIPTVNHVHETARALAADTRVAYVDFEPVAVAYSEALLDGVAGVSITRADIRDPTAVLTAPTVLDVLDFTQPVAVLAVGVLHFIPDGDDPDRILAGYREALAPGSFLALTHSSDDQDDPVLAHRVAQAAATYRDSATPAVLRSRPRITELLAGRPLIDPGLVDIAAWRPTGSPRPALGAYGALSILS